MYNIVMEFGELKAIVHYDDFPTAINEFKECVKEVIDKTSYTEEFIMKISDGYAILLVETGKETYKIELYKQEE